MRSFHITKKEVLVVSVAILVVVFGYSTFRARGDTFLGVTLRANPVLSSGLVGHWTFDGKDMYSNVADSSGQGNNGYLSGQTSTSTIPGRIGQGLSFDGSNDAVTTSNISNANNQSNFTVAGWFRSSSTKTWQMIASKGSSLATNPGWYFFLYQGVPTIVLQENGPTYLEKRTGSAKNDGAWHHVVFTLSGGLNGTIKMYVDGVDQSLSDFSGSQPSTYSTTAAVVLGSDAGAEHYFAGSLDDVRVYNKTLSADEVKRLHGLGATTHINTTVTSNPDLQNGLVGHFTFDGPDISGSTITDKSGTGNNGTRSGTTIEIGKTGQGLSFNGSTDYVSIAAASSINDLSAMTLSAWIKPDKMVAESFGGRIADKRASSGWTFAMSSFNTVFFFADTDTATDLNVRAANDAVPLNQWTHVLVTRTRSTTASDVHIYINGVETSSYGLQQNGSGNLVSDSASNIYIGECVGGNNCAFDGVMDEVRIYDSILSQEEITRLYHLGATTHINTTVTSNPDLQNGLVGHFTFDGKNMLTNVADSSGQGNNGYIVGQSSTSTVPGRIGQGLSFDGSNDYVNIPINTTIPSSGSVTVSAWINYTSGGGNLNWFKKGAGNGYGLYVVNDQIRVITYGVINWGTGISITGGEWYHVVFTYDGSKQRIYKNGSFAAETTAGYLTASASAYIGANFTGAEAGYFRGNIDDIRVYNRALSAEEINRLYQLGR